MSSLGDCIVQRRDLDRIFRALSDRGYTVIGPTVRDNAIVYEQIGSSAELPQGITDRQDGGHYRLLERSDRALFGYNVGPHSWKRFQLPPQRMLWSARRDTDGGLSDLTESAPERRRYAFLGARSCELAAMGILDTVLHPGGHPNRFAPLRPSEALIIAVQCTQAGGTCFCSSMGTGPTARAGFDLALTEIVQGADRHYFLVEVGSERGAELIADVPHTAAQPAEHDAASDAQANAAAEMGREIDTSDIRDLLYRNYEHPRWEQVADRCLSCGNCTMVCPTCFCTTVEDTTDLTGERVERHERWDTCFAIDYSNIHGGAVRNSVRSRYRQWMTHKLATWIDQFGSSGCVGCGRCITWCPVGIDITEEAAAIRASERQPNEGASDADAR